MRPNLVRVKGFLSLKTERWSSVLVAANNAAFGRFVSFSLKCAITCRKKKAYQQTHNTGSYQNRTSQPRETWEVKTWTQLCWNNINTQHCWGSEEEGISQSLSTLTWLPLDKTTWRLSLLQNKTIQSHPDVWFTASQWRLTNQCGLLEMSLTSALLLISPFILNHRLWPVNGWGHFSCRWVLHSVFLDFPGCRSSLFCKYRRLYVKDHQIDFHTYGQQRVYN